MGRDGSPAYIITQSLPYTKSLPNPILTLRYHFKLIKLLSISIFFRLIFCLNPTFQLYLLILQLTQFA